MAELAFEEIKTMMSEGSNLIMVHSNADADAIGAAIALALYFDNSTIYAPSGISRVGKRLLAQIEIEAVDDAVLDDYTNLIVADCNSDNMLGIPDFNWSKAIVIDHHSCDLSNRDFRASLVDDGATSTCELVWKLINTLPEESGERIGLALLTGIIGDSGNFHHAKPATLLATSQIMQASGVELEKAFSIFHIDGHDEISQRTSRLKGGQRMKYARKGGWIVAVTQVSSFEANVARGLLNLGADISFVASQSKENFRITARANPKALATGFHLGNFLRDVAEDMGGDSGGHDGAAGMTGMGESEAVLNICSEKAMSWLAKHDRN